MSELSNLNNREHSSFTHFRSLNKTDRERGALPEECHGSIILNVFVFILLLLPIVGGGTVQL